MATADELRRRHETEGTTPEGALRLWFEAAFLFFDKATESEGRKALQYLTIPYKENDNWDRSGAASTFLTQIRREPHILRSYLRGATPENGYRADTSRVELNIERSVEDKYNRGWNVTLRSSGADMPRPVYLRKSTKTGLWFVDNHANVYVGIRKPSSPDRETFV